MNRIAQILSQLADPLYLAPMEEVSDYPFRQICKEFGADIMISEFVSSDALVREVDKSKKKIFFSEDERPFGIQIFGHHEESLVGAAQIAASVNPDFIDINWGCPVKKVVNKGAGAAILKDIPKMIQLSQAVVRAIRLPVTVKTRLGWDQDHKPIVSLVEQLQDVGVEAVTIHGRTKSQYYGGDADWQLIGEAKNNPRLTIPIIGNGDIDSYEKASNYKNRYGVDALMVGRAAIGNPWIFREIKNGGKSPAELPNGAYLQNTEYPQNWSYLQERIAIFLRHLQLSAEWKGEYRAVLEIRRHISGYFKGMYHFKMTKLALMQAKTVEECRKILADYSKKSS